MIFQGIRKIIAKKPYIFVIFRGGGGGGEGTIITIKYLFKALTFARLGLTFGF